MTESHCSIGDGVTATLDGIDGIDLVSEEVPGTERVRFFTGDDGNTVQVTIPIDLGVLGNELTVTLPRHVLIDHLVDHRPTDLEGRGQ